MSETKRSNLIWPVPFIGPALSYYLSTVEGSDPGPKGAAVECSAERSRAHQRQGVAPAEGRAWETPATRTV